MRKSGLGSVAMQHIRLIRVIRGRNPVWERCNVRAGCSTLGLLSPSLLPLGLHSTLGTGICGPLFDSGSSVDFDLAALSQE